jgi:hypothetical protein
MEPYESNQNDDRPLVEIHCLHEKCRVFLSKKFNLSFRDLIGLALDAGFVCVGKNGSHEQYKHPTHTLGPAYYDRLSFQDRNGKAKSYQVEQLVNFIIEAERKK